MKKRCQTVYLLVSLLLVKTVLTNGELADRSEIESKQVKTLSKRNANTINLLPDTGSSKSEEKSIEDLAKQLYEIYGENLDKRTLETADNMDFDNVDKFEPPYLVLEGLQSKEDSTYYDDDKSDSKDNEEERNDEKYSLINLAAKRLEAPMGFGGRLGKRMMLDYDYDKRIPLGFVGALGKRAPMGFFGQLGKRAPMGFIGQLGKRAPMGFTGQLGKRAPLGFRGQLGKRAPMGFLGTLGKRITMFNGPERRAPMGFFGQLGKRRGPMGFRGQLGKRET